MRICNFYCKFAAEINAHLKSNSLMKRKAVLILFAMMAVFCMAQPPHRHHHEGKGGPRHHHIECASRDQLHMTLQVLENQQFEDRRIEVANLCVTLGRFCTDDLARMARTFTFDASRKKFLLYAYDYCTDPQNYYSLRDVFGFRGSFDEMMLEISRRHRI